jgi:hypothetical protein
VNTPDTPLKATDIWQGMMNALRSNLALFFAVAAPFTLLVDMGLHTFGPAQPKTAAEFTPQIVLILVVLPGFVAGFAQLAVSHLLLNAESSPRLALVAAFAAYPSYLLALVISAFPTALGLLALIVPGVYITARLFLIVPIAIAERLPPFALLRRSWQLTEPVAWTMVLFLVLSVLFILGFSVLGGGVGAAIGSVLTVMGFKAVGGFVAALVPAVLTAIVSIASACASTWAYKRLS